MEKKLPFILFALFIAFIALQQAAFIVPQTHQALVLQFGKPVQQHTEPGLKFKIPFIQQVTMFDRRVLDVDPPAEQVILADQKRIVVDTFARYKITNMLEFHNALKTEEQAASRLNNIIASTLRSTMGTATMATILSEKRAELMDRIRDQVNASVDRFDFGIKIVDVRIGRADLPDQTSQSVFARMRTEREREAAEFRAQGQELAQEIKSKADKERTVLMADAEKQAQILRGQGDEAAIKVYANAFQKDASFYEFYRTLEAYKETLGTQDTTLILKPEGAFFKYLKGK
jgi:modulator of FtsH protease HflC